MDFQSIIRQFSSVHGLPFDEAEEVSKFVVNDKFCLFLQRADEKENFFAHIIIDEKPKASREKIYEFLLRFNFINLAQEAEVVGIDPKTDRITLFKKLDAEALTYEDFEENIKNMLEKVEEVREKIRDITWSK